MFQPVRWIVVLGLGLFLAGDALRAQAVDPKIRGGAAGVGGPISGLTVKEAKFFYDGQTRFQEVETVPDGLGPRFNLNSCGGCHVHPAVGGSSPASNPQVYGSVATSAQVTYLTSLGLIRGDGPIREIRYKSDGNVHNLFTMAGLSGTPAGCTIAQPDFAAHLAEIIFRIPSPTFGAGLIEAIDEATILANVGISKPYGVTGHVNRNGHDATITRFGWKAQNKSVSIFSGEAYNVEMGITNDLFPNDRGDSGIPDPDVCKYVSYPSDHTNYELTQPQAVLSDAVAFANFMRFLAPPAPACVVGVSCTPPVNSGSALFDSTGCSVCHVRSMPTGNHSTAALRYKTANLFSDLLVHNMGALGDGITQGTAGPNDFRTAPLWGVGQRVFFLHDGRTSDLLQAIEAHANSGTDFSSEAYMVIRRFNTLSAAQQQDVLKFLRSL